LQLPLWVPGPERRNEKDFPLMLADLAGYYPPLQQQKAGSLRRPARQLRPDCMGFARRVQKNLRESGFLTGFRTTGPDYAYT
jgi:hypothetical protein